MDLTQELYEGKSFSSLLKDIYTNSRDKEKQIRALIVQLRDMIDNVGDAVLIVPLLQGYLEVAVKNDEALIKMAAIVQKAFSNTESTSSDGMLSETDKEILFKEIKQLEL